MTGDKNRHRVTTSRYSVDVSKLFERARDKATIDVNAHCIGGINEHLEPIYLASSCQLGGFKTAYHVNKRLSWYFIHD